MSTPDSKVLVLDDELGIAQLCQRVLERAGYAVDMVTRPQEGVDLLQQKPFDLLLLDIRMPEMDGFQFMSLAKHHQPDLAVLVMTGFGTVETAIEALRQGADGLILKPFEKTTELVASVAEALRASQTKREVARLLALRPLFSITEALFSETHPERLLDLILNAICGHLRSGHAGFYRRGAKNAQLALISMRGKPLPAVEEDQQNGILAEADSQGVTLVVNREGPGDPAHQAILAAHKLGSVLCAPVLRNVEHSVLLAGRDEDEPPFSEADIEMFGILVRQAAGALENARLYGELRDYVRQVEESQQALIQAEKMAAVGRLTASIAHEINNPLQALRNCLHLARREELALDQREDYLSLAESELQRLMSTVQRMLDFYRPGTGERETADINQLVELVLRLLKKQLEEQDVRVKAVLAENIPEIYVVPNQIQQVFFNIILNAMYAMPDGGDLYIESRRQDGHLEILFEDTGPGVPEETRERIFEPFTSTRENGTGLGLSVSYNILDAHGGSLELLTERDKGACFQVRLPLMERS
jgi:signal transduction histidine kinase/CheY-like chemotaxis protein